MMAQAPFGKQQELLGALLSCLTIPRQPWPASRCRFWRSTDRWIRRYRQKNLDAARKALKNNSLAAVMELPGMNHLLQDAKTGAPSEYNDIEETMPPTALKIITDWRSRHIL
jgi:hypothetical protein